MGSLFDTRTLAPLLQITTTQAPNLGDLEPVVKILDNDQVTATLVEEAGTLWDAGQVAANGTWLGQVSYLGLSYSISINNNLVFEN